MDAISPIAAILAFAPTLILMYVVLRKYTYPAVEQPFFSDPAFFGLFAIGLVSGVILLWAYTYINWLNIIYMVLFAVIQCLVPVVVLNLKRFHGKSDTVFYGYGLGLGIGCTMAFGTIIFLGTAIMKIEEGGSIDLTGFVWLFILALSQILMMSSIGTIIGEGIARYKPMEFALQAILVNVAYSLILVVAYNSAEIGIVFYALMLLALLVAAVHFYYVMYMKLSGVVKDVLRMEGKTRKDVPK